MVKIIRYLFELLVIVVLFMLIMFVISLAFTQLSFAQSKYELKDRTAQILIDKSNEILHAQIGTRESGNNGGEVVKYLKAVGLSAGNPYCMAGQYYCLDQAANMLSLKNPLLKTGSCSAQWNYLRSKSKRIAYKANKDDLIFWHFAKRGKLLGHIGRIDSVFSCGWVDTIEFNTSAGNGSQDDGDGVFKRRRNIYHPLGRLNIRGLIRL